jgi:hypothetical protein
LLNRLPSPSRLGRDQEEAPVKNRIAILVAFGAISLAPRPAAAVSAVDCRKGCAKAAQGCADACSDVDLHGLSVRKCRAVCRSPRVKNACVKLCRQTGIGS